MARTFGVFEAQPRARLETLSQTPFVRCGWRGDAKKKSIGGYRSRAVWLRSYDRGYGYATLSLSACMCAADNAGLPFVGPTSMLTEGPSVVAVTTVTLLTSRRCLSVTCRRDCAMEIEHPRYCSGGNGAWLQLFGLGSQY